TSCPLRYGASCLGNCSSSRMRTVAQDLVGCFERGNHLIARHGRKGVQEFVQAVAAFQVIDEVPERDSRAHEHRRAAKDLRVAVNHRYGCWHECFLLNIVAPQPPRQLNVKYRQCHWSRLISSLCVPMKPGAPLSPCAGNTAWIASPSSPPTKIPWAHRPRPSRR